MRAALVAELRKVLSTRMWWLLLLVLVAYVGFVGLVMAASVTVAPELQGAPVQAGGPDGALAIYSLVSSVGYVVPLVLGSLLVTQELRHRTLTATLLVEPRRGVVLGAKLLAAVPFGVLYGLAGVAAIVAGAAPLLAWGGDGAFLTDGEVVASLAMAVVVFALWTVLGVAFGSVVGNQVAAVVVVLAFTQFVEPIARVALAAADVPGVARFLPGAAADAVIGASFFSDLAGAGSGVLLSRPAGLAVLVAYVVVLAVLGRLTTLRRDVL